MTHATLFVHSYERLAFTESFHSENDRDEAGESGAEKGMSNPRHRDPNV